MKETILTVDKKQYGIITVEVINDKVFVCFKKYAKTSRITYTQDGIIKFIPVELEGKTFSGINVDKADVEKVRKVLNKINKPERIAHVCWECGRTFFHKPASDGTCGEC